MTEEQALNEISVLSSFLCNENNRETSADLRYILDQLKEDIMQEQEEKVLV